MHICMILREFYPVDIRVFKEAKSLIKYGHEVTLICLKKKNQKSQEEMHGLSIYRIDTGESNLCLGLWDMYISIFKTHPKFYKAIQEIQLHKKIDLLHVHDLFLMETGFKARKQFNIKVVCDFHENLPEAFKVWFKWRKNPLIKLKNQLFFGYDRWIKREEMAIKKCDHAFVTVEEMKERFLKKFDVEESKITVILNSEEKTFKDQRLDENIYGKDKNFKVVYTGNIGPHRGVDTAIEAMQFLQDYPIKLYLVGRSNSAVMEHMKDKIMDLGLQKKIIQTGYVPFDLFYSYMKMAQVNIIPHHRNEHTDNTVPHKLFQAMITGNPVLVSDSPPLKRIVEQIGSGLVFEAANAKDFASKVLELYNNKGLYEELGKKGYKATVEGSWCWATEGEKMHKQITDS